MAGGPNMAALFLKSFLFVSRLFVRRIRWVLLIGSTLLLSACGHLFYWPEPGLRGTPDQLDLPYRDVFIVNQQQQRLHGWWLEARLAEDQHQQGVIYFLHGNAENISTHFAALNWITRHGWSVFILDYRGFGLSEGQPGIAGVHHDAYIGLLWVLEEAEALQLPVVLFGQSLGAATSATLLGLAPEADQLAAVVLDSPFSGYRRIAREKMSESWLLWAGQYPLSWLIRDDYSPERWIAQRPQNLPLLILHSCADAVVPCSHGQRLFQLAQEPKTYWQDEQAPHTGMLNQLYWRRQLLQWLEERGITP